MLEKEVHPVVPAVLQYIDDNVHAALSVGGISRAVHYNPEYLRRIFKKSTGESLTAYLKRRRMEASAEYLLQMDEALPMVMETLGYRDRKRFYRHFKEVFGITPGQYRNEKTQAKNKN